MTRRSFLAGMLQSAVGVAMVLSAPQILLIEEKEDAEEVPP